MAKTTFGVCCMKKKMNSDSMAELLKRLETTGKFNIVRFEERMILNEPVEKWPVVTCLLAFASSGFPLEKAIEYQRLHNPLVVNALEEQKLLTDRVHMYATLKQAGIPCPSHMVIDHTTAQPGDLQQDDDRIIFRGRTLSRPFVEKPQDGDDHDVWIYHSTKQGGGCTKLHRKKNDQSSVRDFEQKRIREKGIFIYEPFLDTRGLDIKVYAVGPNYAHAEGRKAPSVDGQVERQANGREKRYNIELTEQEKQLASMVVKGFKQNVCGFDILRTADAGSVVCDVNGFSFVKGNQRYFDDAAAILTELLTKANDTNGHPPVKAHQQSWLKGLGNLCSCFCQ